MRRSARSGGLLAAFAVASLVARPVLAQTAEQVKAATVEAVRKLDLQTELPRESHTSESWNWKLPNWFDGVGGVGSTWGWILLIGVACVVLFAFRDQILTLFARRNDPWQEGIEDIGALTPEAAARTSAAADELAQAGRFVEAMHVLLLRALTELRQRLGEHFADSLTSREIMRHARLPDSGRSSLRDIITRVEWTYFGEHPAALADYTACRDSFDAFVHALQTERSA